MSKKRLGLVFICAAFASLIILFPASGKASWEEVSLEIIKSKRILHIKMGDGILRSYKVSLGKGDSRPKSYRGDRRTPEGIYYITNLNPNSKFFYFMGLSYPNMEDAERGLKENLITFDDYFRIREKIKNHETPPQNTALGGFVGIHGTKNYLTYDETELQQYMDWTQGCIALSNDAILDLINYCSPGTKVVIKE
jgi:murein L,D-transpeptidase YafK